MSTTELKIEKQNAIEAFKLADENGKKVLIKLFGNQIASNIQDRVKTFEDACQEIGVDPNFYKVSTNVSNDDLSVNAYRKLIVIAKALNEGWTPNWSDSNQYKYVPYFKQGSGLGLSYSDYDTWYSITHVGSRLCFKSETLAKYAGTQFADIYNDFLTIK